jgi:hypothetical protein
MSHVFCNAMGFPALEDAIDSPRKKGTASVAPIETHTSVGLVIGNETENSGDGHFCSHVSWHFNCSFLL